MLHILLGFGGRMSRLEYFLACLALGFLTMLLVVALVLGFKPHGESMAGVRASMPHGLVMMLLLVVLPFYLWFSLAFQAKRIRDIGWNPVYVLPGWIAAVTFDRLVAYTIPGLAWGAGGGTLLGTLFNLAMALCLLFWPSRPAGNGIWYGSAYHGDLPVDQTDRAPDPGPRPAAARVSSPTPPFTPTPSGFGRRGL
jgi:uncharacterized membrane protein YhaH (DUF805 family)